MNLKIQFIWGVSCRSHSKSHSIQDDLVSVSNDELDVRILVSNSEEKLTNDHGEAFACFKDIMRERMIRLQMSLLLSCLGYWVGYYVSSYYS